MFQFHAGLIKSSYKFFEYAQTMQFQFHAGLIKSCICFLKKLMG